MFRKIILFLLCTSIVLSMIACGQTPALDPAATDFPTEETQNTGTTNITEETIPEDSAYNYVDFVVEVDPDKDPVVLQLSDPQIIDSSQLSAGYLNADMVAFYAKDKVDERCYNYIRETVAATNPGLRLRPDRLV
ncbi:MAG: hypothetical protein IJB47_02980 [Oscillospiraceae bacterium]|nr:hypothetical protein [Oscillospiraceae bacterium]